MCKSNYRGCLTMPDIKAEKNKMSLEELIESFNSYLLSKQDLDGDVFWLEEYGDESVKLCFGEYEEGETYQNGADVREFGFSNKNDLKDWLSQDTILSEINLVIEWYFDCVQRKAATSRNKRVNLLS